MPHLRSERGLAIIAVLLVVLVLVVMSGLLLYVSGKEIALTAVRRRGAQSLYAAEAGAISARSALMALMNADPIGVSTVDPSLTGTTLNNWYGAGIAATQNSFGILDYLVVNGQRYTIGATSATASVTFHVNWALPQPQRKLQVAAGTPPTNAVGAGTYAATVVVTRRSVAHSSCALGLPCFVHRLGVDEYEYFYTYTVTSDGQMPPRARRRVTLSRDFSFIVRRQNFAQYALFRHITTTPSGAAVWFIDTEVFQGPVHSNSRFRFVRFPKFLDSVTQVDTQASFWNNGSPVTIAANENVVGGIRRDAPVLADATPGNVADDNDNPPANFTRGVATIPIPSNPYSQKGASIGRDPSNISPVTNLEIRQAVPELADNTNPVPNGIYVPVVDTIPIPASTSSAGEPTGGGIYVQGNLDSLTLSVGGATNNLAVYTMVQGAQTVTVTVDRLLGTTTVTNSAWAVPQTRTFVGVPKGWQAVGNANTAIVYVQGNVNSLAGTLEESEQATLVAAGNVVITNNLLYEDPPDVSDPNDNPINLLGVYSPNNHVQFAGTAPTDLTVHAVLMAGNTGDGFNSSVNTINYDTKTPGTLHLIGGIIEEYSGPVGRLDANGNQISGYSRDYKFDKRMSRGYSPPYFPTTTLFEVVRGSEALAGVRPVWREASP